MGVKKLNRLKKFMQVEVDLKRMETKFGGCDFFGSGDIAPFCLSSKRPKFPFGPWTIVKKLNRLKKFMQVEVYLKRMETKFGGRDFSSFGDIVLFCLPSKWPKFPFTLYLSSSLSLTPSLFSY